MFIDPREEWKNRDINRNSNSEKSVCFVVPHKEIGISKEQEEGLRRKSYI